jgi:hypothetical protein
MVYANAGERCSLISGLRALAGFLEDHPEVPAPRWADVLVFPPGSTDRDARTAVDAIAVLIGSEVADETAAGGHYTATRHFGPVQYRAVAIPTRARKAATRQSGREGEK